MLLNKETWNECDYLDFTQYLKSIGEKKTAEFSAKLIPGATNILGVKIPELRKIAGEISRGDWRGFLKQAKDDTFEEVLTQGILIGKVKVCIEVMISLVENYLPSIDNWAVCDCFCTSLKATIYDKDEMLIVINKCLLSKNEYYLRFAVVMLLTYYVDAYHIEYLLSTLRGVNADSYYVKMAIAWACSVCFVKFPARTFTFIKTNPFDDFTFNKTIDKINDSLRVDKKTKIMLKQMKRKIKR